MLKNYLLRYAECYDFIDTGNQAIGAFLGEILIGQVGVGKQNEEGFDKDRSVIIKQAEFPYLVRALKEAKQCYETGGDKTFTMDVREPNKRDTLYKVCASFNRMDQHSEPRLNIRYRWNWAKDRNFHERVKLGIANEMTNEAEPWVWTKRGAVISEEALDAILLLIEKYMHATYIESNNLLSTKLPPLIKFGLKEMSQEVNQQLVTYDMTKLKPKTEFLEKVLSAMVIAEKNSNEQLILQQLREKMLGKVPLVFALFILHSN